MFKRELFNLGFSTALICLIVVASGLFLVKKLHHTSEMLALDTLPGLVDAGLAEERIYQDRRVMREMLFPHTSAERTAMLSLVSTNFTDDLWQDYAKSIYEIEDGQNFQKMMILRSNYLAGLPQLFALVRNEHIPEATDYFNGDSRSAFTAYVTAVRTLFQYNVKQGRDRATVIVQSMHYVMWVLIIFSLMLFCLGLAVGFRVALGTPRRPSSLKRT